MSKKNPYAYKSCTELIREGDDVYCCDLWEGHQEEGYSKHACNCHKVSWEDSEVER